MNFADIRFWAYLAAGLVVIGLIRILCRWSGVSGPGLLEVDRTALAALGLFLLACVSWETVTIFLVVAISSHFGLRWLLRHPPGRHGWYLALLLPVQLLPLVYYKYADFVLNDVMGAGIDLVRDVAIPVGISFYTFQMVGFVIDTLAFKKPLPRLLHFLNFASFFPQIVAGPIERRADLLPQVETFQFRYRKEDVEVGLSWVMVGLFFKLCLADNVALYFHGQSQTNPFLIWLDNILFGLRIYYDFAGYSLVAFGLGRCLGIRLTLNFLSPYVSTGIIEFWRRWHITLSQWFRDYLYVPMGGGRSRWWIWNVAVVFVASGIWHGAGWNFVVWGAMHGLFLILNRLWSGRRSMPNPMAWVLTMAGAFYAWLCFYETRTQVLWAKMLVLLDPRAYSLEALRECLRQRPATDLFVMGCFLTVSALVAWAEWRSVKRHNDPYAYLRRPMVLVGLVILTVFLAPGKNNAFIYFAF